MLRAHEGRSLRAAPTVGVKEGNRVELDARIVLRKDVGDRKRMQVQRAVREHNALGRAGAAAGVKEFGDGVFGDGVDIRALRSDAGDEGFITVLQRDHQFEFRARNPDSRNERGELVLEEEHTSAGVLQDRGEFRRSETHVSGHDDGTGHDDPEVTFQELVSVETEVSDAVAATDPGCMQSPGEPFTTLAELSVGEAVLAGDYSFFMRVKIYCAVETPYGRQRREHN